MFPPEIETERLRVLGGIARADFGQLYPRPTLPLFYTNHRNFDLPCEINGASYYLPEAAKKLIKTTVTPNRMPFFLNRDGSYNETLSDFLCSRAVRGCLSPNTWRAYAYDLRTFQNFLGRDDLLTATREEYDKFFVSRNVEIDDEEDPVPASWATWQRQSSTFREFSRWAVEELNQPEVFPYSNRKEVSKYQKHIMRGGGMNSHQLATIKNISIEDYKRFRDLGLRHVWDEVGDKPRTKLLQRNVAFAELAITSGMRLAENSAILTAELPNWKDPTYREIETFRMDLGTLTTKGRRHRSVTASRRVLRDFIAPYIEEERARCAQRALRDHRYANEDIQAVLATRFDASKCFVLEDESPIPVAYKKLSIAKRKRLYDAPNGTPIVPAMLWLREDGLPAAPEAFSTAFSRASERLQRQHGIQLNVTPHMLRHTYAVGRLTQLIRMMKDGSAEDLRKQRATCSADAYDAFIRDPLSQLQREMGHASQETTRVYLAFVEQSDDQADFIADEWSRYEARNG